MKVSEFKKEMKCGLVACLCAMFPLTGFGQRSVDLDINTPTPLYDNMNDYLYADGPAVVSVSLRATKSYHAGKFEIPVFMEFDANPNTQKAGVVAGVTLRPFRK